MTTSEIIGLVVVLHCVGALAVGLVAFAYEQDKCEGTAVTTLEVVVLAVSAGIVWELMFVGLFVVGWLRLYRRRFPRKVKLPRARVREGEYP